MRKSIFRCPQASDSQVFDKLSFPILEVGIFDVIKNLKQKINHVVLEIFLSLQSDVIFITVTSNGQLGLTSFCTTRVAEKSMLPS